MSREIQQIGDCQYLFLAEIGEPNDNELRIVIHEARSGAIGERRVDDEKDETLRQILESSSPIEHRGGDRIFEVFWPSYVAYSVRNDSFVTVDEYEEFQGRLFVKYSKSRYLDFVANATFADDSYPGPLYHWGIFCLNHILDIVSTEMPEIAATIRT